MVGGLIGTLLGFGVAMLIAALTPLPARIEPWSVALGIGMTAVVGLFFGLYPALRAASLDPIEALRTRIDGMRLPRRPARAKSSSMAVDTLRTNKMRSALTCSAWSSASRRSSA